MLTLAAGTPITLAVAQEANSSTHRAGDTISLTVLNDVRIGDTIVIPRGTPAQGEITWRTGKGAFGKSGKLEFSLRHIDLGGQRLPVSGDYRQEGEGNTIATGIAILAVGVFAGFVTGKRARLPVGRELMSQLAQNVDFTADGRLASSYDGAAAMAAAAANTPLGQCRAQAAALTDSAPAAARPAQLLPRAHGIAFARKGTHRRVSPFPARPYSGGEACRIRWRTRWPAMNNGARASVSSTKASVDRVAPRRPAVVIR